MARKLLKEEHNTTPERLPKDLVKGAYNMANKVINSEYTYAMAKTYMAVSPLLPELWPGTPIVGAYVHYWEGMVPGGSWPDLK